MNDQFLVEVHDSTAEDIAAKGMSPAAALLELNGLFTAWVETGYHHNVHSETRANPNGQVDGRLGPGRARPGHARSGGVDRGVPVVRAAGSHQDPRRCHCTATPTRSNPRWPAGRSKWCSPRSTWNTSRSATRTSPTEKRYRTTSPGTRTPRPDQKQPEPSPAPPTGIDYLAMVAYTHHQRVAADEAINFDALYPQPDWHRPDDQLPGQLSIEDILDGTADPAGQGEATG